ERRKLPDFRELLRGEVVGFALERLVIERVRRFEHELQARLHAKSAPFGRFETGKDRLKLVQGTDADFVQVVKTVEQPRVRGLGLRGRGVLQTAGEEHGL